MADQLLIEGVELDPQIGVDLKWIIEEWSRRKDWYRLYRDYYEGRQNSLEVSSKFQVWFGTLIKQLKLNLCESVVDAVIDRMGIMGWDVGGDNSSAGQSALDKEWKANQGPATMNEVHEGACVEGDSYVLVWPDANNNKRMWPHRGSEMLVYYSPELPDLPAYAGKLWIDTATLRWRLNIYYPSEVLRFRTVNSSESGDPISNILSWHLMPAEEGGWQIPNVIGSEVPVVHFTSGPCINTRGRSDLKNATPVQDALNKSVIDLVVSGEGMALPLRVLTGVQSMPDPETGKMEGPSYDPRTDTWMNIANEQARMFTAAGADIGKLVEGVEHWIVNMARVTKTPPERLLAQAGGVQSGVSRKVADAPLTSKVKTKQEWFDPQWRRVMRLMGHEAIPMWAPATFETDEEKWDLVNLKVAAGMPLPQALSEMGYTDKQIEDMFAKQQQLDRSVGDMVLKAFRAGQDPAALLNGGE